MKKFNSIRDELLFIKKQSKKPTVDPHDVVKFAENPETLLHSKFEWDDNKASYNYRIWQARQIISLELKVTDNGRGKQIPTRLFVSLKDDRKQGGGYRLIQDVMEDEFLREQLIDEALKELHRIKAKYNSLVELAGVFKAIEELEESYKKATKKEKEFAI